MYIYIIFYFKFVITILNICPLSNMYEKLIYLYFEMRIQNLKEMPITRAVEYSCMKGSICT